MRDAGYSTNQRINEYVSPRERSDLGLARVSHKMIKAASLFSQILMQKNSVV